MDTDLNDNDAEWYDDSEVEFNGVYGVIAATEKILTNELHYDNQAGISIVGPDW